MYIHLRTFINKCHRPSHPRQPELRYNPMLTQSAILLEKRVSSNFLEVKTYWIAALRLSVLVTTQDAGSLKSKEIFSKLNNLVLGI